MHRSIALYYWRWRHHMHRRNCSGLSMNEPRIVTTVQTPRKRRRSRIQHCGSQNARKRHGSHLSKGLTRGVQSECRRLTLDDDGLGWTVQPTLAARLALAYVRNDRLAFPRIQAHDIHGAYLHASATADTQIQIVPSYRHDCSLFNVRKTERNRQAIFRRHTGKILQAYRALDNVQRVRRSCRLSIYQDSPHARLSVRRPRPWFG